MFILTTIYLVGAIGFAIPSLEPVFAKLTVYNLLFASAVMFTYHHKWNTRFISHLAAVFIAGYLVELVGVRTGVIFGEYSYGNNLGIKLLGIPLMIGLNWTLLVYTTGTITARLPIHYILQAMLAAGLMVLIDILIEPFAIRYDLWAWHSEEIPLQNYLAWFIVAWAMLIPFHYSRLFEKNHVAELLYLLQLGFFFFLWLMK